MSTPRGNLGTWHELVCSTTVEKAGKYDNFLVGFKKENDNYFVILYKFDFVSKYVIIRIEFKERPALELTCDIMADRDSTNSYNFLKNSWDKL